MNPKVNYGLCVIMIYQCRLIFGKKKKKKSTILVRDVDNAKGHACVRTKSKFEIFAISSQFCCESEISTEKESFLKHILVNKI